MKQGNRLASIACLLLATEHKRSECEESDGKERQFMSDEFSQLFPVMGMRHLF